MLAFVLLAPGIARAEQRPTPEQMKAAAEETQPGDRHRELATLAGEWTQDTTCNMGTSEPIKERCHLA